MCILNLVESLPLKWEVIEQKGDVPSGREGATFKSVHCVTETFKLHSYCYIVL